MRLMTWRAATYRAQAILWGTETVVVVLEDPNSSDDEGRAMLQIVHDLAPDAKLCLRQRISI
jgi:hypothetical protein